MKELRVKLEQIKKIGWDDGRIKSVLLTNGSYYSRVGEWLPSTAPINGAERFDKRARKRKNHVSA